MKIAINTSFGGFSLSKEAQIILQQVNSLPPPNELKRNDPCLIEVIERLGDKASLCGSVKVIEIPDDVKDWHIEDYDGVEWVAEGRTWTYEED